MWVRHCSIDTSSFILKALLLAPYRDVIKPILKVRKLKLKMSNNLPEESGGVAFTPRHSGTPSPQLQQRQKPPARGPAYRGLVCWEELEGESNTGRVRVLHRDAAGTDKRKFLNSNGEEPRESEPWKGKREKGGISGWEKHRTCVTMKQWFYLLAQGILSRSKQQALAHC